MMLYVRALLLRNCGRFTVIESDFGADYRTYTHVTSEALYASFTHGVTWRPHVIHLKDDPASFTLAYDTLALPLWFVPGVFEAPGPEPADLMLDTAVWNVVHEFYPTTSKSYILQHGEVVEQPRQRHVPTYGTIQSLLPDHRLLTYAFAAERRLLDPFEQGQTFLLGKKRTMMQLMDVSPIVEGVERYGVCTTGWLELPPTFGGRFQSFEVAAATMRYLVIRGTTRDEGRYVEFVLGDEPLRLPAFYLEHLPITFA
jgi:hypothetical protein